MKMCGEQDREKERRRKEGWEERHRKWAGGRRSERGESSKNMCKRKSRAAR